MITTAGEIQRACKAGLILVGQTHDGEPEWMGTRSQWLHYDTVNFFAL